MADTLQSPPKEARIDRLGGAPAAKRYSFLTDRRLATLFVLPALAILLFLSIWPLIQLLGLSFTDYSATRDVGWNFIWFDNYKDVLTSDVVHQRAVTTAILVVGAVGLETVLGFAIAYLI